MPVSTLHASVVQPTPNNPTKPQLQICAILLSHHLSHQAYMGDHCKTPLLLIWLGYVSKMTLEWNTSSFSSSDAKSLGFLSQLENNLYIPYLLYFSDHASLTSEAWTFLNTKPRLGSEKSHLTLTGQFCLQNFKSLACS